MIFFSKHNKKLQLTYLSLSNDNIIE